MILLDAATHAIATHVLIRALSHVGRVIVRGSFLINNCHDGGHVSCVVFSMGGSNGARKKEK